tara:strand:- start:2633 stop:2818 length:186 start_codon:yes stop_codon:yes gene_type:complete
MRPLRQFGTLLKDLFSTKESQHFWIRVKETSINHKEKEEQIVDIIELLDKRIKINGQNTEY